MLLHRLRVFLLASSAALPSCGTLMTPGAFELSVTSTPPAVAVVCDGLVVGTTPCEVLVTRDLASFELRRAGYRPCRVEYGTVRNPWFLLNVFNGFVGVIVDLPAGADRNPDTAPVHVLLAPGDEQVTTTWRRSRAPQARAGAGSPSGLGRLVGDLIRLHQASNF